MAIDNACPNPASAEGLGTLETSEILRQFAQVETFPEQAILAARERRAELAPIFIREICGYVDEDSDKSTASPAIFVIFHLLGEWRETSAYRPLARLLQCAPDKVRAVIGGATTETCPRVMAAVCDGDPQPLYDIILNPEADEYVRSGMCEVLGMLVWSGDLDREQTAQFLRDCFHRLQPQDTCYVWDGWQTSIAMLGLEDCRPMVKEAFDRFFIDPGSCEFKDFEEDLKLWTESPGTPRFPGNKQLTLFGDTIEELSNWYCYSKEYHERRRRPLQDSPRVPVTLAQPATNPYRGVGRNDPCPCGSGKKFKACCLQ